MPDDAYWAVAAFAGWICAMIALIYVHAVAKENSGLRKRLSSFIDFDRDGDGKPGGSIKRT